MYLYCGFDVFVDVNAVFYNGSSNEVWTVYFPPFCYFVFVIDVVSKRK